MRTWFVCSLLVTLTAVASFVMGQRYRPEPPQAPSVVHETTIWQTDCGVKPEPGERLEKL
jgi:hypothetical protein